MSRCECTLLKQTSNFSNLVPQKLGLVANDSFDCHLDPEVFLDAELIAA